MSLQGKVLGFSAESGTGAIIGPDGRRYNFSAEDWNGDGAPVPGAAVDFEATDDGRASGVYPLRPTTAAGPSQPHVGSAPDLGKYVDMAARRPGLVGAVVALLICAFVGFIEVTAPPNTDDLSLPDTVTVLEVSDLMDAGERVLAARAGTYMEEIERQTRTLDAIQEAQTQDEELIRDRVERYRQMRDAYGPWYGYERTPDAYAAELTEQSAENRDAERALPRMVQAEAQARLDRLNQDKALINLGFLLYLIPLSAAFVLFMAWTNRSSRLASIVLGVSVAVGVGTIFFIKQRLASLFGDLAGESQLADLMADAANGRTVSDAEATDATAQAASVAAGDLVPDAEAALIGEALLSPGLGAWLLMIVAAGLIALTFGLIKVRPVQSEEA